MDQDDESDRLAASDGEADDLTAAFIIDASDSTTETEKTDMGKKVRKAAAKNGGKKQNKKASNERPQPREGITGAIIGAEQVGEERMRVVFETGGILLQTSAARATNSRVLVKAIKELVKRAQGGPREVAADLAEERDDAAVGV